MSIWYQFDIVAFGDRKAIGKFFNLDPESDIHYIDRFQFSFGQKSVPGLRLGKLIVQNPDLIFLINQSTDYDSTWFLQKFSNTENSIKDLFLHQHQYGEGNTFSKEIHNLYEKKFPYLIAQHNEGRAYEWESFVGSFENALTLLTNAELYREKVTTTSQEDLEMDMAGNDYLL